MNLLVVQNQMAKLQRNETLSILINQDLRDQVQRVMDCAGYELMMSCSNQRIYCKPNERRKVDVVLA